MTSVWEVPIKFGVDTNLWGFVGPGGEGVMLIGWPGGVTKEESNSILQLKVEDQVPGD